MPPADSATAWLGRLVGATRQRRGWRPWAIAVGLVALGLAVRIGFDRWLAPAPFLAFMPSIAAIALVCGWRQAALALVVSTLVAWWLFAGDLARGGHAFEVAVALGGFLAVGGFILVLTTALAEAVRRLDAATKLQDGLFRELQHRVANNMQTVAGMLLLARREIQDPTAAQVLVQAGERIAAMARLHRRLSDRSAYDAGLEPILREVLAEAFRDLAVTLHLDIRAETISFDQMTAIVLLVNEAAMNAAKHVFRPARGTRFEVALTVLDNGRLRLRVRDDGPGLPVAPGGERPTQRLGMTIMRAFAGQLGGALDLAAGPGTTLQVDFAPA